uniref:FHA domain-containing protein n=1 Tax=Leersia perrieri TaxID=77586 RepID=A0A0D9VYI9_9ORYZ
MADAPPPVLTLQVRKGRRGVETRQWCAGAVLRVGRVVTGNDIAVRDAGASQRHLSIEFLPPPAARWAVSDVGSSNGTLLNGVSLVPNVPSPLSDGDVIKIGESATLAVSIAPDSDPDLGPRRSSRQSVAAAAVVEKEKPPAVTRRGGRKNAAAEPTVAEEEEAEPEEIPVVTRRGRPKKAAQPPIAEEHEKGKEEEQEEKEVAVVTRRGGRRKAADPPKSEEHEKGKDEEQEEKDEGEENESVVVPRRGGRRKAAPEASLPPPPPRARSTRLAARRSKAVDAGLDEVGSEIAGKGRGRATRASAKKAENVILEDDDGGEHQERAMAAAEEQIVDQPKVTAATDGDEEEDKVEAVDGEVEENAKASEVEEAPVARRGRPRRAPKGKANAHAASDNAVEEEDGGKGEEVDRKEEGASAGRSTMETMTMREWFERMNEYLPRVINEAAEEALAALRERHRLIDEYISTLEDE